MNIAFYLPGRVPVYLFTLLLGLGAVAGLAWVAQQAPRREALRYVDIGLAALLGGLLGGRLVFVAANWAYFGAHAREIATFQLGGLSWAGTLAGACLGLGFAAPLLKKPLGQAADALLPLLASLSVTAWLGCWLDGCAYGLPVSTWWSLPARDEWGTITARWPVQLLGAMLALAWFGLLDRARGRLRLPGQTAGLGLFGMSLMMLALSFMRADPSFYWRGLRLESWAAILLATASGISLCFLKLKSLRANDYTVKP